MNRRSMKRIDVLWLMFNSTFGELKGKDLRLAKKAYYLGIVNLLNYDYKQKEGLIYALDCFLNVSEINMDNYNEEQVQEQNEALNDIALAVENYKAGRNEFTPRGEQDASNQ